MEVEELAVAVIPTMTEDMTEDMTDMKSMIIAIGMWFVKCSPNHYSKLHILSECLLVKYRIPKCCVNHRSAIQGGTVLAIYWVIIFGYYF